MSARVKLFGVQIDPLTMDEAVDQLMRWTAESQGRCRYVVTPNVDHMVLLGQHTALRQVYRDADLVLADGHPVVWASRLLGKPLPERVPGSDLVPRLLDAAVPARPLRTYLLGAGPGVAQQAARNIHRQWPAVQVVGTYSPPMGFECDPDQQQQMVQRVNEAAPQVLIIGLSAPKQELWVHRHRDQICASVALCVGATIDFLAGHKRRAPRWMQRLGMEWLHRLLSEPQRLARRYARDAWLFPQLVWREWWTGSAQMPR